jgi:hypothetical protein
MWAPEDDDVNSRRQSPSALEKQLAELMEGHMLQ